MNNLGIELDGYCCCCCSSSRRYSEWWPDADKRQQRAVCRAGYDSQPMHSIQSTSLTICNNPSFYDFTRNVFLPGWLRISMIDWTIQSTPEPILKRLETFSRMYLLYVVCTTYLTGYIVPVTWWERGEWGSCARSISIGIRAGWLI